ncbi:hypothetical protein K7X08_022127 [Anisodus acutangulus]|uniref:Uncharacterized protein n=1 Tax=Anisodus acutangulus TaxID=402998 RepID=A0A9Q1QVB3_9SOLA|nr:hypothetical protein K7X08_022127 [Anisodus acutangulus]
MKFMLQEYFYYVIYNRMPVNVGRIITANLQACNFDPAVRSIFFPSTITLLVREVGVKPNKSLYSTLSNSVVRKSFWKKLEKSDGPRRQKGQEERRRHEKKSQYAVQQSFMMRQISEQMETLLQSLFPPPTKGVTIQEEEYQRKKIKRQDDVIGKGKEVVIEEEVDSGFDDDEDMNVADCSK